MRGKLHAFLSWLNICKYQLPKWTCFEVASSVQIDKKLGVMLLVKKMLLWNEHALKYSELCYRIRHVEQWQKVVAKCRHKRNKRVYAFQICFLLNF